MAYDTATIHMLRDILDDVLSSPSFTRQRQRSAVEIAERVLWLAAKGTGPGRTPKTTASVDEARQRQRALPLKAAPAVGAIGGVSRGRWRRSDLAYVRLAHPKKIRHSTLFIFAPGCTVPPRSGVAAMKDMQAQLEKLRTDAAECALIRDLATDPKKRELFTKLADHLTVLASEVERAIAESVKSTR